MHVALPRNFENAKFIWLDLLERSVILIMFGFFAVRMYVNFKFTYSMPVLLLLIAEILPVILVHLSKMVQFSRDVDKSVGLVFGTCGRKRSAVGRPWRNPWHHHSASNVLVDNRQRVFDPNIGEDYLVAKLWSGAGRARD